MLTKKGLADASAVRYLLLQHIHERVAVLGPPCVGKSTILRHLPTAWDMDDVLFPQLTAMEKRLVFRKPWTECVGEEMKRLAQKQLVVLPGIPVFATVVLDVDFIIYLRIEDDLLRKRVELRADRRQSFEACKGIRDQLEVDIVKSGIPFVEISIVEENHGH